MISDKNICERCGGNINYEDIPDGYDWMIDYLICKECEKEFCTKIYKETV